MKKEPITRRCDPFFKAMGRLAESYGDVRLRTGYSEVVPNDTDLKTKFSRHIPLLIPLVSAPMDTVTEADMAIAMAKSGGLGIIHKALSIKEQAKAVSKVKHCLNGFIPDPIFLLADNTVEEVYRLKAEKKYDFFSFLVKDETGKIVGIVTRNNFDFCLDDKSLIADIMSRKIIKAPSGTTIQEANEIMRREEKKILPVFNKAGELEGIYTWSDIKRTMNRNPQGYNLDSSGRLVVGAAVGVGKDLPERLAAVHENKVDVIVIDTAHGDTRAMQEAIKYCKSHYPELDVVAGNVSEGDSVRRLIKAGADGVKVGQGPGSICTTRVTAGIGCPQVKAIYEGERAARGSGVPVCGDGGIEYSGDVAIALGAGASSVMIGSLFSATKESPGDIIYLEGGAFKSYRGMGSLGAMLDNQASRERYGQTEGAPEKLVPEGVEAYMPYKGDVAPIIFQLLGGLRSGLGYVGAKDIAELYRKADFHYISGSGLKESHPHGLSHIKKAPNYSPR